MKHTRVFSSNSTPNYAIDAQLKFDVMIAITAAMPIAVLGWSLKKAAKICFRFSGHWIKFQISVLICGVDDREPAKALQHIVITLKFFIMHTHKKRSRRQRICMKFEFLTTFFRRRNSSSEFIAVCSRNERKSTFK